MRTMKMAALGAAALAITATSLTAAQVASADGFSVTANGLANRGTLADLPPSSSVVMAVSNLPADVGIYAFHCLVPPPGGSPVPTRCDAGEGTLMYVVAATTPQTTTRPIVVNAEFLGKNPNDRSGDSGTTAVDCRTDTCAIYTLGAGRESANPVYINTFRTSFADVGPRAQDWAVAEIRGKIIKGAWQPRVSNARASNFVVTLKSGLTVSLASDACEVSQTGKIRALKKSGTCTVTITSSGDDQWAPYEREITFRLMR
jgi:hypothetical protein